MEKIESTFYNELTQRPQQTVRLIVRVVGDLTPARSRLAELDATVSRSFQLINAIAVTCSAKTALALLSEPWVQAIEEDHQVTVQKSRKSKKGGKDEQQ